MANMRKDSMSSKIPKISMKTATKHEVDSDNKIFRTSSKIKKSKISFKKRYG